MQMAKSVTPTLLNFACFNHKLTSSCLLPWVISVAQRVDELLHVNPPAPARETKSLVNCAILRVCSSCGALDFLIGDKCSGALSGTVSMRMSRIAIPGAVGALDSVGIDGEVDGDLADSG